VKSRTDLLMDRMFKLISSSLAILVIIMFTLMMGYIVYNSLPAMAKLGVRLLTDPWLPANEKYGLAPSIIATLAISLLTMTFVIPLSLLFSIYVVFYCSSKVRDAIRVLVEILAGIPSVVYGAWGLYFLVPLINQYIGPMIGSSLGRWIPIFSFIPSATGNVLSASLVLTVMVLPIVVFSEVEFLLSVPKDYIEASLAIGATKWQMVKTVALPVAFPGIMTGLVLGFGRAVGETMAVSMVCGPSMPPKSPISIFSPSTPITTLILMNIGSLSPGFFEWNVLFSASLLLLLISSAGVLFSAKMKKGLRLVRARNISYVPHGRLAVMEESLARCLMIVSCAIVIGVLFLILAIFLVKGLTALVKLGPQLIYECLRLMPMDGGIGFRGGLLNDIIGSLLLSSLALLFALPIGIMTGIYLVEYSRRGFIPAFIRYSCNIMTFIPSIVYGVVGFSVFVVSLKAITGGISLLSGALTMSLMIFPYVARSTEEALLTVPSSIKEAVYALGGRKYHAIVVALKQSSPTLVAASLVALLRAMSESAPVILTAGPSYYPPSDLWSPIGNLAARIYLLGMEYSKYEGALDYMYASCLIILFLILILDVVARLISRRLRRYVI